MTGEYQRRRDRFRVNLAKAAGLELSRRVRRDRLEQAIVSGRRSLTSQLRMNLAFVFVS